MRLHERLQAIFACRLDSTSKVVLVVIAEALNTGDEDQPCWLGVDTIAERAGCSRSTAFATLDGLQRSGVVRVEQREGSSSRRWISWSDLAAAESPPSKRGGARRRVDPSEHRTGSDVDPSEHRTPPVRTLDGGSPNTGLGESEHRTPPVRTSDPNQEGNQEGNHGARARPAPSPLALVPLDASPPKRKAKGKVTVDPEAWQRCADLWADVSGKARTLDPAKGEGRNLGEALTRQGSRLELRLAFLASPAGRRHADFVRERSLSLSNVTRAASPWCATLDVEAEEWDRAGRPNMQARASPPQRKAVGGGGFWSAFDDEQQRGGEVFDGDF